MEEQLAKPIHQQTEPPKDAPASQDLEGARKIKVRLATLGFVLFLVFVVGLFWLATSPEQTVGLTLSFAAGLSMIFLPCTLPMAFVIVPMAMGKDPKKGFLMAVFFGLGLTLTLSFYGVFIAALGKILGLTKATQGMLLIGGGAAFIFGLSEIGLLKFRVPSYSGNFPAFIQKQGDYLKTFLLGLFLGNAGVGCPNPAFYVLLGYIASVGDLFNGWFLGFVHGAGRAVPLIFLAILGVLGVNATTGIAKRKDAIEKYTGWMLIVIGAFILTFGLFGHDWFVASGIHSKWEQFVVNVGGERFGEIVLKHEHKLVDLPEFIKYGNGFMLALIGGTILVYIYKNRPPRKTIVGLASMFAAALLLVGVSTNWTFTTGGENVHLTHGGADEQDEHAEHEVPSASDLEKFPLRTPADRVGLLPFVEKDGVKEFHLTIDEIRWEYADGKFVHAWGYNGEIPGPEIRVIEGDKVRVIVKNNLSYSPGTTIHWHGVRLPENEADGVPGLDQYPIKPGETYTYEFTAANAGTHFYHTHGSSHVDVALQDDMGLHGPLIIEPRDTTDIRHASNYDREYIYLLDEWAVGEDGSNHAIHLVGAEGGHVHQESNLFTINGRIFPDNLLAGDDIMQVKEGERVLVRLINNGSESVHPMHTHGHAFRVMAVDGNIVPPAAQLTMDTITLHPGERRDIEIIADNPGVWLFHCHNVHHASSGMILAFFYDGYEPCCLDAQAAEELLETDLEERTQSEGDEHAHDEGEGEHEHEGAEGTGVSEEGSVREGLVVNLNFSPVPASISATTRFDFFVNEKPGNKPVTDLEIEHEKLMHVIGARDDLEEFFHIHPKEATESAGLWSVEHQFEQPGLYKLWTNIRRAGMTYTFGHPEISIKGEGSTTSSETKTFGKNLVVGNNEIGNYQISFEHDEPIVAGREADLVFSVSTATGGIAELEPFLGADMHLANVKDDLKTLIHAYPEEGHEHASLPSFVSDVYANGQEEHAEEGEHKKISFHVTFPELGIYRAFAQFRPEGIELPEDEALVAGFWLKVEEGKVPAVSKSAQWWGLLIASLVLMTLLGLGVRKYLTVKAPAKENLEAKTETPPEKTEQSQEQKPEST